MFTSCFLRLLRLMGDGDMSRGDSATIGCYHLPAGGQGILGSGKPRCP